MREQVEQKNLDPTPSEEPIVYVRRQWSDWKIGGVRMSSLTGFHLDTVSGGVRAKAPREFLHAYILCTDVVSGEIAHSCRHGPPPHRVKVCIVQRDNDKKVYKMLRGDR